MLELKYTLVGFFVFFLFYRTIHKTGLNSSVSKESIAKKYSDITGF